MIFERFLTVGLLVTVKKHLQNVDYSLIILLFLLSLIFYVKLNKIVQKEVFKLANGF